MTPNTRKPTELEPDEMIWHWYKTDNGYWKWGLYQAVVVRAIWEEGDRWLPYSAIPDPNNTQQG
jgi:hypothetical protein